MKWILLGLISMTTCFAVEPTYFDIIPGKYHKGGHLIVNAQSSNNPDLIVFKINYEIYKKGLILVPNEYLKGIYSQKLPASFLDERGYLELEQKKQIVLDDAKVVYLGRAQYKGFSDAHLIHILPHNKKSEIFLLYHPSNKGLGIDSARVILHTNAPGVWDYELRGTAK
jgi:hypothetical protein